VTKKDSISQSLTDSHRVVHTDKAVSGDVVNSDWSNLQLVRLVAKGKLFKQVKFSHTTFDSCYLPDCRFDSCEFIGTKFNSTNLHGAKFSGCRFDYATFERTIIDDAILIDNCPAYDNLKMRFARSLRTNYQQIGDAEAANHAIRVELDATEMHLRKAWRSNDHYYRTKYPGLVNRTTKFISWGKFRLLDYIWGNGESLAALFRAVAVLIVSIAMLDLCLNPSTFSLLDVLAALWRAPQIFMSIAAPWYISSGWLTLIAAVRFIAFGLLMSILIKRFNRR
jgi:hypothetical protein